MPDFSRQNHFLFFSRTPLVVWYIASGIWVGLFLSALLPTACGAVRPPNRTAEIPVVSLSQNSGELYSLVNGFHGTTASKRTPYQDALAAAEESKYGQIQLASGNFTHNPQNPNLTKIKRETIEPSDSPSLSFRDQPSQIPPQPLGSTPFQGEKQQATRPIRSNTDQRPRPLNPNQIETVRYGRDFTDSIFSEAEEPEELQFAPFAETYPEENSNELVRETMNLEESWEEPGSTSSTTPNARSALSDFSDHASDLNLLSRTLPEQKEKKGEQLAFSPVGPQLMPLVSVLGSLCLVLGAFFLFVLLMKKVGPKNGGNLPKDALENIGRYPLNPKLQLNLIRLGNRLILVAVTPDGGVETISEIESPDEVAHILAQCRKLDPNGSQAQFKSVLNEFAQEKSSSGFFGPSDPKRKTNTTPTLSSLLAGGLQEGNLRYGGIYG